MSRRSLQHAFARLEDVLVSHGDEIVLTARTNLEITLDAPLAVSTAAIKSHSPARSELASAGEPQH